jgi:aminopeptidase N
VIRTLLQSAAFTLLLGLAAACVAASPGTQSELQRRVVLPAAVTPERYRIEVTAHADALTFEGSVQIDVTVHLPVHEIVLNSADLVIEHAAISGAAQMSAITYDDKAQTATLALDTELQPGAYTLSLTYHGKINQQASGLFALDYDTPQGKVRALFTQFENSDARRFAPLWDEPGRKATFDLTAIVPSKQMALSNMPVAATDDLGHDLKRVHFATTPKMSSYLLFLGVGDFERVQRTVDGVDLGVVVKRGDTANTAFALDAAAHLLSYYNDYFAAPYPLPKLDLIAAPGASQFFGAMENWGAMFCFERDLLIDQRISTEHDRQDVYIVVAHEMAHQWFGDLVTMAWWNDLWLNEGFASWMENKVVDHFHPEWKMWLQSLRENDAAMDEDARDGTHPIITPIDDVLQASDAFDAITYLKGAAVVRMLEAYVGEDAFRAGVRRYIHDYAYGNTVTDDLWQEMDRDSQRPITQMAHDFTLQAGVPMLDEVSARCRDGRSSLRVAQSHFAIDADSTMARLWQVPAIIASIAAPSVTAVVTGAEPRPIELSGCAAAIINAGQTGYFRSHYSDAGMAAVAAHYADMSPEDQLGVLNDTRALVYSGKQPMAALLELLQQFPPNADPVVTAALVGLLRGLDHLYDGRPTRDAYHAYARSLLNPIFARLGWDKRPGDADNIAVLRSSLIAALSDFGDLAVLAEARQRFKHYVDDPSSVDAGVRRAVLGIVVTHADRRTWDQLHAMAKSAPSEIERQDLYDLLAAPQSAALVQQALDLAVSGEPPPTVAPDMISTAARRHPALAFDFASAHWQRLGPLIEPASQVRFVPSLVADASDVKLIGKLDAFAARYIPASARQDLHKAESNIRYLAAVVKYRLPQIDRWIRRRHQ